VTIFVKYSALNVLIIMNERLSRHSPKNVKENVSWSHLTGATRSPIWEKRIRAMTDGIRASTTENCRDPICTQFEAFEQKKYWMHSLGFLDLEVYGKSIQDLVDTGATHNLMMTRLEREVGMNIFPTNVEVKAVKSKVKVSGLADKGPI